MDAAAPARRPFLRHPAQVVAVDREHHVAPVAGGHGHRRSCGALGGVDQPRRVGRLLRPERRLAGCHLPVGVGTDEALDEPPGPAPIGRQHLDRHVVGQAGDRLELELGVYLLAIGMAVTWAAIAVTVTVMLPSRIDMTLGATEADPSAIRSNPWA